MSTINDSLRAFFSACLGQNTGTVNDLQKAFTDKYAGGLDSYTGALFGRKFKPGLYYTNDNGFTESAITPPVDQLMLSAFTVGGPANFDLIGLETTVGGANSSVDVVVYDSDLTTGAPRNRLFTTNIVTTGVGVLSTAIPGNLSLPPGVYWIGGVIHGTAPTVRVKPSSAQTHVGAISGASWSVTGYGLAGVAGVPSATNPPVVPYTGSTIKIFLRAV